MKSCRRERRMSLNSQTVFDVGLQLWPEQETFNKNTFAHNVQWICFVNPLHQMTAIWIKNNSEFEDSGTLKSSAISQLFFTSAITFLFNCIILIPRDWHGDAVKNQALKRLRLHRWEIHYANSVVLLRAPIYTWKIRTAHELAHSSRSQPDDRPNEIHKIKIYLVSLRCDDNNIDTNNSYNKRDQRGAEERNNNSFKIKIHCVASLHRRLNVLIRAVKCRIFSREKKTDSETLRV